MGTQMMLANRHIGLGRNESKGRIPKQCVAAAPQYFTDFDSRYLEQSRGNVPCELHVREQSDEVELLPSVREDRSKLGHTL